MSFTQSLVDFRDDLTYDEKTHALAMAKGVTNFVVKGLDLTGTTLTSGIFSNTGTFAHLGKEGETHTITANFTGFLVIKTTLSGSSSTSVIEESSTREDTDPRDTSNIKYFTIYELNAGVIVQDFRHINYVKSFYLKNMGESNIAWVLNGFTSQPFDASVLAGNRTYRLSPIDIGVPDSTLPNDVDAALVALLQGLNDTMVDKGGSVAYDLNVDTVLHGLIGSKINSLINWSDLLVVDVVFDFEMTNLLISDGLISQGYGHVYLTEIESNKKYTLPINDFVPRWEQMTNGVYFGDVPEVLATSPTAFETTNIPLIDSIYNFESVICGFGPENGSFILYETRTLPFFSVAMSFQHTINQSGSIDNWANYFSINSTGLTLSPNSGGQYTNRYSINLTTNAITSQTPGLFGILNIRGLNRIHPRGTTHTLSIEGGIKYRIATHNDIVLSKVKIEDTTDLYNTEFVALNEV